MCFEEMFDTEVPQLLQHCGPWIGSNEGSVEHLRLHYRLQLQEQRFVVIYASLGDFAPEP